MRSSKVWVIVFHRKCAPPMCRCASVCRRAVTHWVWCATSGTADCCRVQNRAEYDAKKAELEATSRKALELENKKLHAQLLDLRRHVSSLQTGKPLTSASQPAVAVDAGTGGAHTTAPSSHGSRLPTQTQQAHGTRQQHLQHHHQQQQPEHTQVATHPLAMPIPRPGSAVKSHRSPTRTPKPAGQRDQPRTPIVEADAVDGDMWYRREAAEQEEPDAGAGEREIVAVVDSV